MFCIIIFLFLLKAVLSFGIFGGIIGILDGDDLGFPILLCSIGLFLIVSYIGGAL